MTEILARIFHLFHRGGEKPRNLL